MHFPRYINAIFSNSESTELGTFEGLVILLTPDITLSIYDHEWVFRTVEPVKNDQNTVNIELATCRRFKIFLNKLDFSYVDYISEGASFIEIVQALTKK